MLNVVFVSVEQLPDAQPDDGLLGITAEPRHCDGNFVDQKYK